MIYAQFITPPEMAVEIARRAQEKRLFLNMSQRSLSEKSGVSLSVIKKFEHSGKISLESLLKLAVILDSLSEFGDLFKKSQASAFTTLDALLASKMRKRGRK